MTRKSYSIEVALFGLLGAVMSIASPTLGQDPTQTQIQARQDQAAQSRAPSGQNQAPAPLPAATPSPQNQSQPGVTSKEQQNIDHEKEKGTSKDRIFWALPNFLTVENADNVPPLSSGQKFKVVGRSLIDPSEFILIGFIAALGQASNSDSAYGQGAQGYAKRYGTAYGDNAIENFMASAVLPSLLHQDPRYYQLGRGGFLKRTEHAVGRVFITRSDSGQKQFNYSEVFGAGIAATISTYSYHPSNERNFGNVASVWGSQIGFDVATYMVKEFWPDLRKKHHQPPTSTP